MQSNTLRHLLDKWPGKKYLGVYRFLPIFFGLGAALEFSMINWKVGSTNFYTTYKKREAENLARKTLAMLAMMAGSQTIHVIYHPLDDLDILVQKEIERLKKTSPNDSS